MLSEEAGGGGVAGHPLWKDPTESGGARKKENLSSNFLTKSTKLDFPTNVEIPTCFVYL